MKILFHKLGDELRDSLIEFLWDQWVSVGLVGNTRPADIPFVIDPEALLLATTRFARHDSRFMGEVIEWLHANDSVMSMQRIKTLTRFTNRFGDPGNASIPTLSAIAEEMVRSRKASWKSLIVSTDEYPEVSGIRNRWRVEESRGKIFPPDTELSSAFLFRMRYLFGVNARAEILTWLLTHDCGHPALIARETEWFSKSVQAILNDLEKSGLVKVYFSERKKQFQFDREKWLDLLSPAQSIRWFTQPPFYHAIDEILHLLEELSTVKPNSVELQSSIIRKALGSSINVYLAGAGMGAFLAGLERLRGQRLVDEFRDRVGCLCRMLREDRTELLSQ